MSIWKGFQSLAKGFGSLAEGFGSLAEGFVSSLDFTVMGTSRRYHSKALARIKRSRERADLEDALALAEDYLVILAELRSNWDEGTPAREILDRKIRAKQDEIQKIKDKLNKQ